MGRIPSFRHRVSHVQLSPVKKKALEVIHPPTARILQNYFSKEHTQCVNKVKGEKRSHSFMKFIRVSQKTGGAFILVYEPWDAALSNLDPGSRSLGHRK